MDVVAVKHQTRAEQEEIGIFFVPFLFFFFGFGLHCVFKVLTQMKQFLRPHSGMALICCRLTLMEKQQQFRYNSNLNFSLRLNRYHIRNIDGLFLPSLFLFSTLIILNFACFVLGYVMLCL